MRKTLRMFSKMGLTAAAAGLLLAAAASAQKITFKDPAGDDNGPGTYTYPTDSVYKRGSFDITEFSVNKKGDKVDFDVTVNSPLEDPWGMKTGFSTQMVFIFIDTDGKEGSGSTDAPPGLNVKFAPTDAWDRLVILSPQAPGRVKDEVSQKASAMQSSIVIPNRVKGAGRTISGTVDLAQLGGGDPSQWGYQVVMQSNEGFPDKGDLLTRKVNEYEGQHRFGGGTDSDCDPHAIDILAGKGAGGPDEVQAQHDMLKYECNPDGTAKTGAVLKMVRK
jgi:carbohydrate-binding DOMON domain-containing protein